MGRKRKEVVDLKRVYDEQSINVLKYSYEDLKACVHANIPERYFNESVIVTRYKKNSFLPAELNFNPYKPMLPYEFYAESRENPDVKYKVNKGSYSTLFILKAIPHFAEYKLISDLAIATVLNDFFVTNTPYGLKFDNDEFWRVEKAIHSLKKLAGEIIKENNYDTWVSSAKYYLPYSWTVENCIGPDVVFDPKRFGKWIAEKFHESLGEHIFIYSAYPEEEYERAEQLYENISYSFQREILETCKKYKK